MPYMSRVINFHETRLSAGNHRAPPDLRPPIRPGPKLKIRATAPGSKSRLPSETVRELLHKPQPVVADVVLRRISNTV